MFASNTIPPSAQSLIGTLSLGMCLSSILAAGRLVVPLLALAEGYSMFAVGLLSALIPAMTAIFVIPFGRLMDTIGVHRPLIALALIMLVAALATIIWPHTPLLFIVAPLIGFTTICGHIGVTRAVGAAETIAQRSRNVGYLALCYSVCQFLGPVLGGQSFDWGGPRFAFLLIALLSVAALVILVSPHNRTRIAGAPRLAGMRPKLSELLGQVELRRWIISNGTFSAALTALPFITAIYCREIGLSTVQLSWIIGFVALGAVTVRMFLPRLTKTVGLPKIVIASMVFAAAGYLLIPMLERFDLLLAAGYIIGLGVGAGMPVSTTLIYGAAPPDRVNESIGISMALSSGQQVIAPLLVGFLANTAGVAPAIGLLGISLLATVPYLGRGLRAARASQD